MGVGRRAEETKYMNAFKGINVVVWVLIGLYLLAAAFLLLGGLYMSIVALFG